MHKTQFLGLEVPVLFLLTKPSTSCHVSTVQERKHNKTGKLKKSKLYQILMKVKRFTA